MVSAAYDLSYLQASVDLLEDYLLSTEIYWSLRLRPPVGDPPFPMLTLGGVLLARMKAGYRNLSRDQRFLFNKTYDQVDAIRVRWRVAWENKSTREFHSRLMLWRDYLDEYRRQPYNHVDRYGYEVHRRVLLALLYSDAVGVPSAEKEMLTALDHYLQSVLQSSGFIWEPELAGGFPKENYWYLWGKPRE